jgi:hypothetical protein
MFRAGARSAIAAYLARQPKAEQLEENIGDDDRFSSLLAGVVLAARRTGPSSQEFIAAVNAMCARVNEWRRAHLARQAQAETFGYRWKWDDEVNWKLGAVPPPHHASVGMIVEPLYLAPASPAGAQNEIPKGAARTADGTTYHGIAEIYHRFEEGEALHMHLDDEGVPRADADGKVFSLVGRIARLIEAGAQNAEAIRNQAESAEVSALRYVVKAADWWEQNSDSPKSALSHFVNAAKVARDVIQTGSANTQEGGAA